MKRGIREEIDRQKIMVHVIYKKENTTAVKLVKVRMAFVHVAENMGWEKYAFKSICDSNVL